jgi:Uma2 family endonuclease
MTAAEYLAFERAALERHEFEDGQVIHLPSASWEESLVGANLRSELANALGASPFVALGASMRLRVPAMSSYYYPDLLVLRWPPAVEDEHERDVVLDPVAVGEVLSPATEPRDRGRKLAAYRSIAAVHDCVLLSAKRVRVEHFRRAAGGDWVYRELGPGGTLELESVGCAIPVEAFYRKVFPAAGARRSPCTAWKASGRRPAASHP